MAGDGEFTRAELTRLKRDLGAFAAAVGWPLTDWQLEALRLETKFTVVVGPRQVGKSVALAVLACWWAFRKARQHVLILSSVEGSALELLAKVREIASHPLLAGSVDEELKTRVVLDSGSWIQSVTSSERAVRGKTTDLLLVDECALIDPAVLEGAALPTIMARANARVVLASSPWGDSGSFHDWAVTGMDGSDPSVRTFRWHLSQAPWVTPETIESLRRRLPPPRFAAEVMGEFIGASDALIPPGDIDACVADYPLTRDGRGMPGVAGLDWGLVRDYSAIAVVSVCQDYGQNGRSIVCVPWLEHSQRPYPDQVAEVGAVGRLWALAKVVSEKTGVGAGPTTELPRALPSAARVEGIHASNELKGKAFGRLCYMLAERSIAIPDHPGLIAELKNLVARPTPSGELRIGSRTEAQHDDYAHALAYAVWALPENLALVPLTEVPDGVTWVQTPAGVKVPVPLITVRPEAAYDVIYGGLWHCPVCRYPVPSRRETCSQQGCAGRNPGWKAPPLASSPASTATAAPAVSADGSDPESVPIQNYANPHMRECLRCGHRFDGSMLDRCPRCHPSGPGGRMAFAGGLPAAHARALMMGPGGFR